MTMLERFVNKFKKEGVDHIRIHPHAETTIGKITSKDWRQRFFVPHVGEFTSPVCFANWICTGDDEARHNPHFRFNKTVRGYLHFVLYAKFFQLAAMRSVLKKEMKDLPFVVYKLHLSGIKEFDRWKDYPTEIKKMIEHVLDPKRGPKVPYDWETNFPGLENRVNNLILEMVGETEDDEEVASESSSENTFEEVKAVEVSEEGDTMASTQQPLEQPETVQA